MLLCSSILLLNVACTTNPKVVIAPSFESNSNNLFPAMVQLYPDSTLVTFDVWSGSKTWVRLAQTAVLHAGGDTLPLMGTRNMTLGEKMWFGDDGGCMRFTLIFGALPKGTTSFDFYEGYTDGSWVLKNISLVQEKKSNRTIIEGTMHDLSEPSGVIIFPFDTDIRTLDPIYIPIFDGTFYYTLYTEHLTHYNLVRYNDVMHGGMTSVGFISENATLNFDLIPQRDTNPTVSGGEITKDYDTCEKRAFEESGFNRLIEIQDSLEKNNAYYSKEMQSLEALVHEYEAQGNRAAIDSIYQFIGKQSDEYIYTSAALALDEQFGVAMEQISQVRLKIVTEEVNLGHLFILEERIFRGSQIHDVGALSYETARFAETYRQQYAEKFADETAVIQKIENYLSVSNSLKAGGKFIDFSAPDLNGNTHTLSELINGKVALIDLWASWCGGCRKLSVATIPIYEKYKEKGFTVVGVARENGNTDAMKEAIQMHQFPWINLVDLNDSIGIWNKYGVGNAGGGTYLVDENGIFLAISPTTEELDSILQDKLK